MMNLVYLGLAGAAGSIARYSVGKWAATFFNSPFPYGTIIVNIAGCLLIGLLGSLFDEKNYLSPELRTPIIIGFLGAFTTFSSFGYDAWLLIKNGDTLNAAYYICASFALCFVGLFCGILIAKLF